MDIKFLSQNTLIKLLYQWEKNYSREKGTGGRINKSNSRKGCHDQSDPLSRPIFEQHFDSPQERWGQQISDQFKKTEQFYSLSSFQNKGFVSGKGITFAKTTGCVKWI